MHVARKLLERGEQVIGVDSLSNYYDVRLKQARLDILKNDERFTFHQLDISDSIGFTNLWKNCDADAIIHLAAQAGVRYSIENPRAYIDSNVVGFFNILEACRSKPVKHLVYASSSSVYGNSTQLPFSEHDSVDHPISLYAATKKSNELMAHAYSHLFQIPTTGLRFFTVYGPWGRPDMSPILFADAIVEGQPINVFNHGKMQRDFTFIDDVVESVLRVLDKPATPEVDSMVLKSNSASSTAPYRIFNIGNHSPISLMSFIEKLENHLGQKAIKNFLPMQPGDLAETAANVGALSEWVGFEPSTSIDHGLERFVDWYGDYRSMNLR
jgi:UDP-glucuronate 4-epimerase